jgi:hypothetical protein
MQEKMVSTVRFAYPTDVAPVAPTYFTFPASFFIAALIEVAASS